MLLDSEKVAALSPVLLEMENLGMHPYLVGGFVRDSLIGKESKDIDILVEGAQYDQLKNLLSKYGKTDLVGESFGVIKWQHKVLGDIDISIPRRENSIGIGHKDFKIITNGVTVREDLGRRDFTVNAIAYSLKNQKYYDPFNGISDLNNGLLKSVDGEKTIQEDPLRMLRGIQFMARFNLDSKEFRDNCIKFSHHIDSISKERIAVELNKLFTKYENEDSLKDALNFLIASGIAKRIFPGHNFRERAHLFSAIFNKNLNHSLAAFLLHFSVDFTELNDKLLNSGGFNITKINKFLKFFFDGNSLNSPYHIKKMLDLFNKDYDDAFFVIKSHVSLNWHNGGDFNSFDSVLKNKISMLDAAIEEPVTLKDLCINGNDLFDIGYRGKEIGIKLNELLNEVHLNPNLNHKDILLGQFFV